MRVGIPLLQSEINARGGWVAGFYYVRNALGAMACLPPEDLPEVVAFVPAGFDAGLLLPPHEGRAPWLRVVAVPADVAMAGDGLQAFLRQHPVDVVFPLMVVPPAVFSARAIGWIPDFQHKVRPELFSPEERYLRDCLFTFIAGFCDRIACSSQSVRSDLQRFYPQAAPKAVLLRFVSLLSPDVFDQAPPPTLERLGLRGKYIYLPNQFWTHKNHRLVFEAWNRLKAAGHRFLLVCTGSPHDYRSPGHYEGLQAYLSEHGLQDDVRLLGFVGRDDQLQLYRGAAAVLQPSTFEGWSTSIEDAKSLGKRLIVSDIPVHREQCGEDALYFDVDDPDQLADTIARAWGGLPDGHDPVAEATARSSMMGRAQEFGRSLVAVLREVAAAGPPSPSADREIMLPLLVGLEADRAARLRVIDGLKDTMAASEAILAASEADRAARLDVINAQKKILDALPVRILRYLRIV